MTQSLPRYRTAQIHFVPALVMFSPSCVLSTTGRICGGFPLLVASSPTATGNGGERGPRSSVTHSRWCEQRFPLKLEGRRTEPDAKPRTERLGFGHWSVNNQFPLDFSVSDNRPFSRPRSPTSPTYNKPRPRTTPGLSVSVTYPKKEGQPVLPYTDALATCAPKICSNCQTTTT